MCGKAQKSDPKDVFVEAAEGGSIGVAGMRLWKVVIVVGLCSDVSQCCFVTDCIRDCNCC